MRVRFFSLISYAPVEFIHDVCVKKSTYYAYILHDKDITKDGVLYEPHYHVLFQTINAHEPSAVCKWFRGLHGQNTFAEEVHSTSIYDYLTHTGFEDKFQYSPNDIVSNDISKFQTECDLANLKVVQLLDDINAGCSLRFLASRYGRDFILNSNKYITYAHAMRREEKFESKIHEIAEPFEPPTDFAVDENEYYRFNEYIQLCTNNK